VEKCGKVKTRTIHRNRVGRGTRSAVERLGPANRRGLGTSLHALGVDDIEIQRILRHSNIGITQKMYIKSVTESQVTAMELVWKNSKRVQ
jgi:integrase